MHWYCFINRIAWRFGWTKVVNGHRFVGDVGSYTRCGFRPFFR